MAQITGRVIIEVTGIGQLLNKEGAVASGIGISGEPSFELEEIMGDTGMHGAVERPVVSMLEVTITDRDDISLSDLANIGVGGGTSVTFKSAARSGGKAYTLNNAWCTRNFQLTAGDGDVTVVFKGDSWTEATK